MKKTFVFTFMALIPFTALLLSGCTSKSDSSADADGKNLTDKEKAANVEKILKTMDKNMNEIMEKLTKGEAKVEEVSTHVIQAMEKIDVSGTPDDFKIAWNNFLALQKKSENLSARIVKDLGGLMEVHQSYDPSTPQGKKIKAFKKEMEANEIEAKKVIEELKKLSEKYAPGLEEKLEKKRRESMKTRSKLFSKTASVSKTPSSKTKTGKTR